MPYQQVGDCSIFYEDNGIGDPILFLHSAYSRGIIAFSGQIQPFFHSCSHPLESELQHI